MREGWTYKKLGEVCEIICGQDYKNVESPNGKYPIYGTGGIMGYANQFRCPAYSVIVGRKGSINNPIYVEDNFWNVDTAFGIVPSKASLSSKFFFYFCKQYDFTKHNVAVTIPSLRRVDLLKITIPVPPLSEQEHIVSELDLLSSIIDKKKAQLKEYDQLTQSIFYDMFGDPVMNEKGWEVKKLNEICKLFAGGDVPKDRFSKNKTEEYIIPVFSNGIENEGLYGYTTIPKVSSPSITISGRGTIGFVALRNNPFFPVIRLIVITPISPIELIYLKFYAIAMNFKGQGVAIPQLTVPMIKDAIVPLPPLSLQQSFASKIESIERQKALIKQSIEETETLFNSRMDYWFN